MRVLVPGLLAKWCGVLCKKNRLVWHMVHDDNKGYKYSVANVSIEIGFGDSASNPETSTRIPEQINPKP